MKIDTLILSGASSKGIGYVGALYALSTNTFYNFNDIKNIIACSSGAIFGFMLLLNFNAHMMYKLLKEIDMIDLDNFSDDLLVNNGIFNNNGIKLFLISCLKNKYNLNDINFIDLYKKTKIRFVVKVYNLSLQKQEYFSYKNKPNMSVIDAIQISTCIPIIFKPIKYNNYYYIDGGIINNIPHLKNKRYKNYLLIYITSINNEIKIPYNYDNIDFFDYIKKIINIINSSSNKKNKRNFKLIINLNITDFNIQSVLDKIILDSYHQTLQHIQKYNL
jgi:predicted acylesterase/phospholipase RssA